METNSHTDNIPKEDVTRVVLLSKNESSVTSTVNYLTRNGIEVFATTDFQAVIERLSSDWSRLVILSVNYPHPKIEKIPRVFAQGFNAQVIPFAEIPDRKATSLLLGTGAKHIIYGKISGPSALVRITQVETEHKRKQNSNDNNSHHHGAIGSNHGNDEVRISGNDQNFIAGNFDSNDLIGVTGISNDINNSDQKIERATSDSGVMIQKGRKSRSMMSLPPTQSMREKIRASIRSGSLRADTTEEGPSNLTGSSSEEVSTLQERIEIRPLDILVNCAREALKKACAEPDREPYARDLASALVLVFNDDFFRGTILIAVGQQSINASSIIVEIEKEFIGSLVRIGANVGIGSFNRYDVVNWAVVRNALNINGANLISSHSYKCESCIVIVEVVPEEPSIVENSDKMLAVTLSSLIPERPLSFDIFLHLPQNQKYLRYVKEGLSISKKQVSNLFENKINSVFLNQVSYGPYRQYAVVNNLKKKLAS